MQMNNENRYITAVPLYAILLNYSKHICIMA